MHCRVWFLGLAALLLAACSQFPQEREARYMEFGKRLLEKKDYVRAGIEFRNAKRIAPGDAEPYYQLGLAYLGAGDRGSAAGCFRKATELDPKHRAAQLQLAKLLAGTGDEPAIREAQKRAEAVAAASPHNVDALNTLALTELQLGKPEEATAHLEQALTLLPGSFASSALLMRARLAKGDVQGAAKALMECYRKSPQSAEVALVMGRFYLVTRRPHEAEEQFRRAIRIDSGYGAAWLDLGITLFHAGRHDEAGQVFKQVAALPGKMYKPAYAIFLLETGQPAAATVELERLAKGAPDDRAARTRLVKVYALTGRRADAEKLLAAAIAKNPRDADALLQRSELSLDAQKYQDAQNDLNLVLRYHPDSPEPHIVLARLDGAMGRALQERQELGEALRLDPGLLAARLELARLLIASKGDRAALEILRQAPGPQQRDPALIVETNRALLHLGRLGEARQGVAEGLRMTRTPDLQIEDAWLKVSEKNYNGARAELGSVLRKRPDDIRALRALVQVFSLQKQPEAALKTVRSYAAQHPHSAPVQEFLGELLMADGRPSEARAAFTAAKAADPNFLAAGLALARLDASEGKPEAAYRTVLALLVAHPDDAELWLHMGWIENLRENYPQAVAWFRKVVVADPANVAALNNLAYLLAQSGRLDEALKYAQQVKQLAPDNPGVDDTIGWIMYRQGLYKEAVRYLEDAAHGAADPVIRYHLGMAYLKTGDKRGEITLRAALKQAPLLPEARMAERLLAAEGVSSHE